MREGEKANRPVMLPSEKKSWEERHSKLLLGIILTLGVLFRFIYLGAIPKGLFCDEISRGYDAYCLLKTLKDQYGNFLPLFTETFGLYPPATPAYLMIPAVQIFGLSDFSVRLMPAVIGVLTLIVFYFLVKEWINKKTALLATLLLAVSPWHIHYSRIAFEAILLPFFFLCGLLFFFKAIRKNSYYLIPSALFFIFSMHTYYAARGFVPPFLLGLVIIYRNFIKKNLKATGVALTVFLIPFIFLVYFWLSPQGSARLQSVGLVSNLGTVIRNYFNYFSPLFIFFEGESNLRHHVTGFGQLYAFEIFTVIAGILALFYGILRNRFQQLLLWWLILYPIPGALADSEPVATRALVSALLFAYLSASGALAIMNLLKIKNAKIAFSAVLSLLLLISTGKFAKAYFADYANESAVAWQYGIKEMIAYTEGIPEPVVISAKFLEAHVFLHFYLKTPPEESQKNKERKVIGKYTIAPFESLLPSDKTYFYAMLASETRDLMASDRYEWRVLHSIKDYLGREYLQVIELKVKK